MARLSQVGIFAGITAVVAANPWSIARAVVTAMDTASNPAYAAEVNGAWKGTYAGAPPAAQNPPGNDNGGFGFLPWSFDGGSHELGGPYGNLNHFIAGVDFPTTTFNDLGAPAFGLGNVDPGDGTSHGVTAFARRQFGQPLQVGDVFSAEFDSPAAYVDLQPDDFNAGYPFAIIRFLVDGAKTLEIEAGSSSEFGDFPWRLDDANGNNSDYGAAAGVASISPTATSDGSSFSLKVTGPDTGHLIFDGIPLDVQFISGVPTAVSFILFDNDAEAAPLAGDFNDSGTVDGADLAQWKGDFAMNADSDADGDGDSDGSDFLLWQRNLGGTGDGGPPTGEHAFYFNDLKIERPSAGVAAVPEPASIAFSAACWGAAAGAYGRRSRRKIA